MPILQGFLSDDPEMKVIVSADRRIAYGKVVEVLDIVKGSGVPGVTLAVRQQDD